MIGENESEQNMSDECCCRLGIYERKQRRTSLDAYREKRRSGRGRFRPELSATGESEESRAVGATSTATTNDDDNVPVVERLHFRSTFVEAVVVVASIPGDGQLEEREEGSWSPGRAPIHLLLLPPSSSLLVEMCDDDSM